MTNSATVSPTDVTTEEEAMAAVEDEGLFGLAMDFVGSVEDFHWHDFDAVVYVISGEAAVEYEDGRILRAGPGTLASAPAGTVHRDVPGASFRGVFGFSVDPSSMTQPINKPLSEPDSAD